VNETIPEGAIVSGAEFGQRLAQEGSARPLTSRAQAIARGIFAGALVALGVWLLWSFMPALAWAAIISIATWPLYQRLKARFHQRFRRVALPAAFTVMIGLVFVVPLAFFGILASREAQSVFAWIEAVRRNGLPVPDWAQGLPWVGSSVANWWHENLERPDDAAALVKGINHRDIVAFSESFGGHIGHIALTFTVTLLTLFFLFKDGEALSCALESLSTRLFGPRGKPLGLQIVSSIHGTVDGLVFVGIGEGLLLTIAYYVAGVPQAAWLGVATAIGAIIPFGAFVMFSIASLLLIHKGSLIAATVIFLFGLVVLTIADHLIRPIVIGNATRLPFLLVLLGILGGVETCGLLGLFLGPVIMTVLVDLWREATDMGRSGQTDVK
jgi:predicted PurR-regulated permease PerM